MASTNQNISRRGCVSKPNIMAVILINENLLTPNICRIVGMYTTITDDDRIMFMLINRELPEIFLRDIAVVDDLDEVMTIKYARENDQWSSMTMLNRLTSLADRTFTVVIKICDFYYSIEYSLKIIISYMRECEEIINDPNKKTNPDNIFAKMLSMGCKTVFRMSSDWMLL